jgi:hypothetical protein
VNLTRATIATALQVLGALAVVVAVGHWSPWVAVGLAGLLTVLFGIAMERGN